jgi:hypothetical protein
MDITVGDDVHKTLFYEKYTAIFKKAAHTNLITKKKYDRIVKHITNYSAMAPAQRTQEVRRHMSTYAILSNVGSNCLYRKDKQGKYKRVPTYEQIFDIISTAHDKLSHPKCVRKNKAAINDQWYGVPLPAVRLFLDTCPVCVCGRKVMAKRKMNPLKMIISEHIGSRAQIDLIDFTSHEYNGMKWLLRYADHLSTYSHIRAMATREAEETGVNLVHILSSCIMPKILQSDNGSEFLGE